MRVAIAFTLIALSINGCVYVNERGISATKYNECKEYYDSMGFYHKDCPDNAVEYEDIKQGAKKLDYFHIFSEEEKKAPPKQTEDDFYDF